jgi:hypothetical protein
MAGTVTFSLEETGGTDRIVSSAGGGGGALERATGISSDAGAFPTRTTTA